MSQQQQQQQPNNSGHSIYSPSKAHRYMVCPGSVALEETCEDSTSVYAQEGTAAHDLAEQVLTGKISHAEDMLGHDIKWTENGEPVSWTVCPDMVDNVTEYVNRIRERVEEFKMLPKVKSVKLHVEERVDFSDVIGIPDQSGTADIVIEVEFEDDTVLLSVEDLKYGQGVIVDAEDNEQLLTYAAGVMSAYELVGYDVVKVNVAIHQIRKKHLSEHTYDAEEVRAHGLSLRTQARVAEVQRERFKGGATAEELVLNPGEKQCKFCKAKAICPAIRDDVAQTVFDRAPTSVSEFDDLTEEDCAKPRFDEDDNRSWLAACMGKIDMIEDWCKSIRARTFLELENGEKVPGYKLVEGKRGNRAWVDQTEAEEMLKSMRVKQDDMYEKKLISPTKAEKLLKGSARKWNRAQKLITRADGKPSVAPESDKRPALIVQPVGDNFDDLTEGEDLV